MFSTSTPRGDGGPATATRSRRRQRPLSQDNIAQQPKAKRQRIPLTEQTFVNPEVPHHEPEPMEVKMDKAPVLEPRNDENRHSTPHRDLNVRAKKSKHSDRAANKGDGSLVLTSTNAYTVSKLPALPDRIRKDWSENQNAEIFSSFGYALTLTSTHAIVWPYNSTSQSPETFTFTLPSASKPSDPLPVGCLVSPSASSSEPGLVVVTCASGRVAYWESISSAATLDFIRKGNYSVEHAISGMSSGEKVTAITNAESAGFILTFNTGRLAYMNVRDSHGRPAVSVQFLRSGPSTPTGGLFGSIRHAFSGLSLRGEIAAVRADRSSRVGERNIVALGGKGRLTAWRIHRGGHNDCVGEVNMKDQIYSAMRDFDPICAEYSPDTFEALDFTFIPQGLEQKYLDLSRLSAATASDDFKVQHILLLVSLTQKSKSRYALVEVNLSPSGGEVAMIRPITSYSTPTYTSDAAQSVRPRVYLPRPALVAFLVFERAAVLASVAVPPESPESQLQSDNHRVPASFEDVVDFREDNIHEIVGSGFEETPSAAAYEENRSNRHKAKNPSAVLMVRGAGVIRLVTTDIDKFASEKAPVVSAKSKLEQAVFFGIKQDNPIIFDGRRDISFSGLELSHAAWEVSQEILCSSSGYTSTLPAVMEDNLRVRSQLLERLMTHLRTIGADLDRKTRWQLLWNAEKMHVARGLWKLHQNFTASRPADDKKSLIGSIVEFIHQDQKHNPVAKIGEVDRVRHWFVNDVDRLELFVTWAYEVIKTLYKGRLMDDIKITVMMHEAVQINICAHTQAIEFRKDSLDFYGLGNEELRLGILPSYESLGEPWTGSYFVANNLKRLFDLSESWIRTHKEEKPKPKGKTQPDPELIESLYESLPLLLDSMLTAELEFARFAVNDAEHRKAGQDFGNAYRIDKLEKPLAVARAGHWEAAAKISQKHKSFDGYAAILLDHVDDMEIRLATPEVSMSEKNNIKVSRAEKRSLITKSFSDYGQDFAFPLYEHLLEHKGIQAVLGFDLDTAGWKTKFLRSRPELAKVSWMNDVQREHDINHAAETLIELALFKEQNVWNKRVELSLSKLALLADAEERDTSPSRLRLEVDEAQEESRLKQIDEELTAISIQDQLYSVVSNVTWDAIDGAAALKIAMETFSMNIPRRQKALYQVFEDGMRRLLQREALDPMTLIDLLTLISLDANAQQDIAHPFWMALKVAHSCCHGDEVREAKRLVWRRLLIRDDWTKINDTRLKSDSEVVVGLADTHLFGMLKDCISYEDALEPFQPIDPSSAIGAFSETLDRRFRSFDSDFQARYKDVMKHEDKTLSQYLEKHKLASWLSETVKAARQDVESSLDEATEAGAAAADEMDITPTYLNGSAGL